MRSPGRASVAVPAAVLYPGRSPLHRSCHRRRPEGRLRRRCPPTRSSLARRGSSPLKRRSAPALLRHRTVESGSDRRADESVISKASRLRATVTGGTCGVDRNRLTAFDRKESGVPGHRLNRTGGRREGALHYLHVSRTSLVSVSVESFTRWIRSGTRGPVSRHPACRRRAIMSGPREETQADAHDGHGSSFRPRTRTRWAVHETDIS